METTYAGRLAIVRWHRTWVVRTAQEGHGYATFTIKLDRLFGWTGTVVAVQADKWFQELPFELGKQGRRTYFDDGRHHRSPQGLERCRIRIVTGGWSLRTGDEIRLVQIDWRGRPVVHGFASGPIRVTGAERASSPPEAGPDWEPREVIDPSALLDDAAIRELDAARGETRRLELLVPVNVEMDGDQLADRNIVLDDQRARDPLYQYGSAPGRYRWRLCLLYPSGRAYRAFRYEGANGRTATDLLRVAQHAEARARGIWPLRLLLPANVMSAAEREALGIEFWESDCDDPALVHATIPPGWRVALCLLTGELDAGGVPVAEIAFGFEGHRTARLLPLDPEANQH